MEYEFAGNTKWRDKNKQSKKKQRGPVLAYILLYILFPIKIWIMSNDESLIDSLLLKNTAS